MDTIIIAIIGSGALSALISGIFGLIQQRKQEKSKNTTLVNVLAYDRIKYLGKKYIENGQISHDDLEDITRMWQCYHDAGGNGYLDNIMSAVKKLPLVVNK